MNFNDFVENKFKIFDNFTFCDSIEEILNELNNYLNYLKILIFKSDNQSAIYNLNTILYLIKNLINLLNLDSEKIKEKCINALESKSHDYAQEGNRFWNFEKRVNFLGTNINFVFLNDIYNKVLRLENLLLNNKTPKNETVEDSIIDLINYVLLFQAYKLGIK